MTLVVRHIINSFFKKGKKDSVRKFFNIVCKKLYFRNVKNVNLKIKKVLG